MRFLSTVFLFSVLMNAGPAAPADAPAGPRSRPNQVTISEGMLEGVEEDGVRSFKGIPYAQPPVGHLRWREPQPVQQWAGVRRADRFGARPMQPTLWDDMIFRSEKMSEDCLYLNVWTTAKTRTDRLPVLVYFHGGAFVAGDGSEPRYDGASMSQKGIVVVTINYRLGIFGFLAHPELTAESSHHASGNYGFLDQVAALRWVQRNIAAFGGDPTRVTIAGQSAGAASVSAQMASPLARGLFVAAIGESGSALGRSDVTLADAEQDGVKFAASTGARSLAALRSLSAEALLKVTAENPFGRGLIVDGYFMPESLREIYFTGRQADVPLLAGWNSAEVGFESVLGKLAPTPENYVQALRRLYGARADDVLKLYPATTPGDVEGAATALAGDLMCGHRTWKWIDLHSKSGGKPVYRYLYTQLPPAGKTVTGPSQEAAQRPPLLGAPHSAEIPYALGNLSLVGGHEWTEADLKTSATMQDYFANFIKTGSPNGERLPHWPWIQASIPKIMLIQEESGAVPEPNAKRYVLLDSLLP